MCEYGEGQTLLRNFKFMRSQNESKIVKYDSLQMFLTKIQLLFQVKMVVLIISQAPVVRIKSPGTEWFYCCSSPY